VLETGGATPRALADAAGRLAGDGWRVTRDGDALDATRDGIRLTGGPSADDAGLAEFTLRRAEPERVLPLALAGLAAGALLAAGWAVAVRALRRRRPRAAGVVLVATTVVTLLLLPATLMSLTALGGRVVRGGSSWEAERYAGLADDALVLPLALVLLTAAAAALLPDRRDRRP
jgi:hypothetical protein